MKKLAFESRERELSINKFESEKQQLEARINQMELAARSFEEERQTMKDKF